MALERTCFVAEITIAVDAAGTLQTFLFGTAGFSTTPADTPAGATVSARLRDPGTVRRELFIGPRVTGAVRPSFGVLELANDDGALDIWTEYGTSNGTVVLRWGPEVAAYPAGFTAVYTALIFSLTSDFTSLRLVLRDRSQLLDDPFVTATFTGAGAREGEGVAGRRKHVVIGEPGFTPVQLIDAARGIVYVQANAADSRVHASGELYALYAGGVRLTYAGSKSDWAAFAADAPAQGEYTVYVGDADTADISGPTSGPVFMRYGGAPDGELRVRSAGYLRNNSAEALRRWKFSDLLARAGVSTALTSGSTDFPLGHRWLGDESTYADIANDCARALVVAWGFDAADQPFAIAVKHPSDTSDAADISRFTFTAHNASGFRREPIPGMEAPVWQVNVNAGQVWPVPALAAASADARAEVTRQWPYTSFTASAPAVRIAHPGAISDTVRLTGRYGVTRAEQQAYGDRYLTLFGGRGELIRLTCVQFDATTLALKLHDKVELLLPRFGCSPARTFRIVGMTHNLARRELAFVLWGGEAGPVSGGVGGGVEVGDGPLTPGIAPGGSGSSTVPTQSSDGGSAATAVPTLPPCDHYFAVTLADIGGGASSGVTLDGRQTLPACAHVFDAASSADPLFSSRVLLLHGNGANGSTTIIDSSSYAHTCTANGGAQISTGVATMFAGASIKLGGTTDSVTIPDHAAFDFGAGEVVWDFWLQMTAASGGVLIAKASSTSGLVHEWSVAINNEYATIYYGTRGTNQFNLRLFWPTLLPLNTRVRGSVQRTAAGAWACHLGGVKGTRYQVAPLGSSLVFGSIVTGTYTNAFNVGSTTNPVMVGNFQVFAAPLPVHIEELRMSVGAGAYGASYVPELEPFFNS